MVAFLRLVLFKNLRFRGATIRRVDIVRGRRFSPLLGDPPFSFLFLGACGLRLGLLLTLLAIRRRVLCRSSTSLIRARVGVVSTAESHLHLVVGVSPLYNPIAQSEPDLATPNLVPRYDEIPLFREGVTKRRLFLLPRGCPNLNAPLASLDGKVPFALHFPRPLPAVCNDARPIRVSDNGSAITVLHNHDHVHAGGDPSLCVGVNDGGGGYGAERDGFGLSLLHRSFLGGLAPFLVVGRVLKDLSGVVRLRLRRSLLLALLRKLFALLLRGLLLSHLRCVREFHGRFPLPPRPRDAKPRRNARSIRFRKLPVCFVHRGAICEHNERARPRGPVFEHRSARNDAPGHFPIPQLLAR